MRKKSKRKSKSKKRKDGSNRFKTLKTVNIQEMFLNELSKIENSGTFLYSIDLIDDDIYKEMLNVSNIDDIKYKLNKYIDFVKYADLYPKDAIKHFKKQYLKKLIKIKEKLDQIAIFTPRQIPSVALIRQESYEESPYMFSNNIKQYKHKTDTKKKRMVINDKRFDIEDLE